MEHKIEDIQEAELEYIERLFYIYKSYEIMVKIIFDSLQENESNSKKEEVLKKYSDKLRLSFIELDYARRKIISNHLPKLDHEIEYTFDFENREVRYSD